MLLSTTPSNIVLKSFISLLLKTATLSIKSKAIALRIVLKRIKIKSVRTIS